MIITKKIFVKEIDVPEKQRELARQVVTKYFQRKLISDIHALMAEYGFAKSSPTTLAGDTAGCPACGFRGNISVVHPCSNCGHRTPCA